MERMHASFTTGNMLELPVVGTSDQLATGVVDFAPVLAKFRGKLIGQSGTHNGRAAMWGGHQAKQANKAGQTPEKSQPGADVQEGVVGLLAQGTPLPMPEDALAAIAAMGHMDTPRQESSEGLTAGQGQSQPAMVGRVVSKAATKRMTSALAPVLRAVGRLGMTMALSEPTVGQSEPVGLFGHFTDAGVTGIVPVDPSLAIQTAMPSTTEMQEAVHWPPVMQASAPESASSLGWDAPFGRATEGVALAPDFGVSSTRVASKVDPSVSIATQAVGTRQVEAGPVRTSRVETSPVGVNQVEKSQTGVAQVGTTRVASMRLEPQQVASTQVESPRVGSRAGVPTQPGFSQLDPAQVESTRFAPTAGAAMQFASVQGELKQVALMRATATQVVPAHAAPTQVGPTQVASAQVGDKQVDPAQVSTAQMVTVQVASRPVVAKQVGPMQVASLQVIPTSVAAVSAAPTLDVPVQTVSAQVTSQWEAHSQVALPQEATIPVASAHAGVDQGDLTGVASTQVDPVSVNTTQAAPNQPALPEVRLVQAAPTPVGLTQVESTQVASPQVALVQEAPTQTGLTQEVTSRVAYSQTASIQGVTTEVRSIQTGHGQVAPMQVATTQAASAPAVASQETPTQAGTTIAEVAHAGLTQEAPAQVASTQVASVQIASQQAASTEAAPEVPVHTMPAHVVANQVAPNQVAPALVASTQTGPGQAEPTQVAFAQAAPMQAVPTQAGLTQASPALVAFPQVISGQVAPQQVASAHVGSNLGWSTQAVHPQGVSTQVVQASIRPAQPGATQAVPTAVAAQQVAPTQVASTQIASTQAVATQAAVSPGLTLFSVANATAASGTEGERTAPAKEIENVAGYPGGSTDVTSWQRTQKNGSAVSKAAGAGKSDLHQGATTNEQTESTEAKLDDVGFSLVGTADSARTYESAVVKDTPVVLSENGTEEQWNNLAAQVRESLARSSNNAARIRIKVHPETLGEVQVDVTLQGEKLIARFVAETDGAKELIEAGLPQLQRRLRAEGIALREIAVEVTLGDRATSAVAIEPSSSSFWHDTEHRSHPGYMGEAASFASPGGSGGFTGSAYQHAGSQQQATSRQHQWYAYAPSLQVGTGWSTNSARVVSAHLAVGGVDLRV